MFDASVGLYYLNARFYDSRIARFMSEDPLFRANNLTSTDTSAMTQTLNLYTYVMNNPLRYWDPTGLSWVENAHGVRTWDWNSSNTGIRVPEHLLVENGNFRNDVFIYEVTVRNGHFTNNGMINILNAYNSSIVNNGRINTINMVNSVLKNNGIIDRVDSGRNSTVINEGHIGTLNVGIGSNANILNWGLVQNININPNSMANILNNNVISNLTVFNNGAIMWQNQHKPTDRIMRWNEEHLSNSELNWIISQINDLRQTGRPGATAGNVTGSAITFGATPPMSFSQAGMDLLVLFEGFFATPIQVLNEPYYTIGFGQYGIGIDSMSVGNSDPHFIFNGIRYDANNPMPRSVAYELKAQSLPTFQNPVNRFIADNNITLSQHQFDALVIDTYQRGQNTWGNNSRPLQDFLLNGDFTDLEAATAAFNTNRNAVAGVQNRRIMQAEFFVTGAYTDIR